MNFENQWIGGGLVFLVIIACLWVILSKKKSNEFAMAHTQSNMDGKQINKSRSFSNEETSWVKSFLNAPKETELFRIGENIYYNLIDFEGRKFRFHETVSKESSCFRKTDSEIQIGRVKYKSDPIIA